MLRENLAVMTGAGVLVALLLVLWLVLLVCVPLLLIWSLNTLFGLGIGYSLKTWLAMMILSAPFVRPQVKVKTR